MRRAPFAIFAFASAAACGPEVSSLDAEISFRRHELACEVPGIEAKLEATTIPGVCPLTVAADRSVSGTCRGVPTGEITTFRLVYFTKLREREVELATALATIDLTQETREVVLIDFPQAAVNTNMDEDGDSLSNLTELCTGRDPLVPGA